MTEPVLVSHPTLVVCIACYNEERFIAEAVKCLQSQTFTDFAVFVSDNCSTDNTELVARQAIADDKKFTYFRQSKNVGSAQNHNFVRERSESPLFMWLGGHDLIDPEFLEKHVTVMRADPSLSVSFSDSGWIREDGSLIEVTHGFRDRLPRSPLLRYFLSVRSNDWMNEITNVIRRSALDGFTFGKTWGPDIVGLAHLAYGGPMHRVQGPLYRRRIVQKRDHDYMQRLTGKAEDAIDYPAFLAAFERQFLETARTHPLKGVAMALARPWLRYRFGVQTRGPAAVVFKGAARLKDRLRKIIPRRAAR